MNHPPAACVPLTLTLKNEGKETVAVVSASCGSDGLGFDLMGSDGNWEPFPSGKVLVCARNILSVQILAPGESSTRRRRLGDADLELDLTSPAKDVSPNKQVVQMNRGTGYARISGTGPYQIRAREKINGCVILEQTNPANTFTSALSRCPNGRTTQFASIQSTAL